MKIRTKYILLLLVFVTTDLCCADALIVVKAMKATTIAEIYVEQDRVRVELEIGMNDVPAFKNVLPDELYEKLGNKPLALKIRLKKFVQEDFVISADGENLPGFIADIGPRNRIRRDEISGEPLPVLPDEAETVLFVICEYPFEDKPASVTIAPPSDPAGYATANIGFIAYHLGLAVNDFRYLSGTETLDLDWVDPWYSQFRKRSLWRRYKEPMAAFIYVEPFEVRREIMVRPKDLQQWIDLGLEGKEIIKAEDQPQIKQKVAEFLSDLNPVAIDGNEAGGTLDRIHFLRRTLKMTSVIDPPEDLPAHSATLGVIHVYPINGLPQEVTMEWGLFNERIQKINAATTDEAGGFPYPLSPDDSILKWQNFLKNPTIPSFVAIEAPQKYARILFSTAYGSSVLAIVASAFLYLRKRKTPPKLVPTVLAVVVLAAIGLWPFARSVFGIGISKAEARDITLGLLKNVYHAFDYRNESTVYDTLAHSATGDLLTQIFLEVQGALVLENQGGAKVKVKEVELKDADISALDDSTGYACHCSWVVTGSVGHWGHIHQRQNAYEAVLRIEPAEGAWKITSLDLRSRQRL